MRKKTIKSSSDTTWVPNGTSLYAAPEVDLGGTSIYSAPDGNLGGGFLYAAPDQYLPGLISVYAVGVPTRKAPCQPPDRVTITWPPAVLPRSDTEPEIRALLTDIIQRLDRMERAAATKKARRSTKPRG